MFLGDYLMKRILRTRLPGHNLMMLQEVPTQKLLDVPLSDRDDSSLSHVIGKYVYIRTLGCGCSSTVILVRHTVTKELYVCKVVSRELLENSEALRRFEQELRIFERVDHPNIVRFHEVVFMPNFIGIIMEYCPGGDLVSQIIGYGRLSESKARRILLQVASGIKYLHSHNICHRDIKLDNILFDASGRAKICDFGVSSIQPVNNLVATFCGSYSYIAPEVLLRRGYDGRKADVWSLGIALYMMCKGEGPWIDNGLVCLAAQIAGQVIKCPVTFTPALIELLCHMLDRDVEQRHTIDDVLQSRWLESAVRDSNACARQSSVYRVTPLPILHIPKSHSHPGGHHKSKGFTPPLLVYRTGHLRPCNSGLGCRRGLWASAT
jgi:serine/threonine protein kinase